MKLGIPQIIIIVMYGINIGMNLAKDGEPKDEKYNFISSLIAVAICSCILWAGGFF